MHEPPPDAGTEASPPAWGDDHGRLLRRLRGLGPARQPEATTPGSTGRRSSSKG